MEARGGCQWIEVATARDERGVLSYLEEGDRFPFRIKRFFFIREVPHGATRARHVLHNCDQFFLAAAGRFTIGARVNGAVKDYQLFDDGRGLFLPAGYWRELRSFSEGAVCLVLASETYARSDYADEL